MAVRNLLVRAGADFSGMRREMNKANKDMKQFRAGMSNSLKKLAGAFAGAFAVKKVIDFGKESFQAASDMAIAEAKLSTIMRQRMNATDDLIGSVKNLISEQEKIGVVDAVAQTAAAQELATYLSEASNLRTLIPTLNDLVAQQYGLSASAEQATGMATMLGKVMDGQVGALSRYGFTFDKAQEHILKFGSESQRAELLVSIVKDSIGDMNAELGKTPQGRLKQLQFTLDSIRVTIGNGLLPVIQAIAPHVQRAVNALLQLAQIFSAAMSAIFGGDSKAQTKATQNQAAAVTELGDAYTEAGKAASGSVAGFDEVNTLANKSGGGGVPGIDLDSINSTNNAFAGFANQFGETTDEIAKNVTDMIDRIKKAFKPVGDYIGELTSDFKSFYKDVKPALQDIADVLKKIEVPAWETLKEIVKDIADDFKTNFKNSLAIVKGDLEILASLLKGDFSGAANAAWDAMKKIDWLQMFDYVQALINPVGALGGIVGGTLISWLEEIERKIPILGDMRAKINDAKNYIANLDWATIKNNIVTTWNNLKTDTGIVWDGVKFKLSDTWKAIKEIDWRAVKDNLSSRWNELKSNTAMKWDEIKSAVSAKWMDITKLNFNSVKASVQTVWNEISRSTSISWSEIATSIKNNINSVIDRINSFIDSVNSIRINIPVIKNPLTGNTLAGGGSIGMPTIPKIPRLAKGGITNGPMVAMIGDNPGGREVVSPLDGLLEMMQAAVSNAIMAVQMNNASLPQGDVVFKIGETELARFITPFLEKENKRLGGAMITT